MSEHDDETWLRREPRESHSRTGELCAALEKSEAEVARLTAELAAGGNYVADREVDPTCVWFRNGRKVSLKTEVKDGRIVRTWLDVGRAATVELAAAEGNSLLPDGE